MQILFSMVRVLIGPKWRVAIAVMDLPSVVLVHLYYLCCLSFYSERPLG